MTGCSGTQAQRSMMGGIWRRVGKVDEAVLEALMTTAISISCRPNLSTGPVSVCRLTLRLSLEDGAATLADVHCRVR